MRVEQLGVKGVLSFRNEIRLDFRELTGLVAVVGINGAGKSTLMETPFGAAFRMFPSRSDRELYDYAHDRDSYLSFDFSVVGRGLFRARLVLDAVGRKAEAVLQQIHADGMVSFLNDGKLTTYDAAIRELLPAPAVLLASAFAAQNRHGSFVTLDRKGKKELFALLLGLSHYEQMAETARKAATLVEQAIGRMRARHDVLASGCGPDRLSVLSQQAQTLFDRRARLMTDRDVLTGRIDQADATHTRAVEQAQIAARLQEQYRQALADVQQAERQITDVEAEQYRAEQTRQHELVDLDARHTEKVADLRRRIDNNAGLKARAEEIRVAAEAAGAVEQSLAALALVEVERRNAVSATEAAIRSLDAEIVAMRQQQDALTRATEDAATLGTVPCHDVESFSVCRFLTRAVAARATIAGLQTAVAPLAGRQADRASVAATMAEQQRTLVETIGAIQTAGRRLGQLREAAKDLPRLEACEARLAELRTSLEAVDRDTSEHRGRIHTRAQEQQEQLTARFTALREQRQTREQDVQRLRAEVDPLADAARITAAADLRLAQQDLQQVVAQLAGCDAQQEALSQAHAEIEARRQDLARAAAALTALETELLDWQTLAKAFGREGLPTLEIDAAGPTVSGYCNELLEACFGGRFRVELVTQEAKAGGKGVKESFSLQVYDHARGGTARDIADLSGGEQIIVDECLKSALAVYNNRRSQAPMRTCWRDETTGPLDPDNAARYLAMLRKLQQLAGFETVFFVTHSADAAITADAQIWVHDGAAEILFPPFGERRAA